MSLPLYPNHNTSLDWVSMSRLAVGRMSLWKEISPCQTETDPASSNNPVSVYSWAQHPSCCHLKGNVLRKGQNTTRAVKSEEEKEWEAALQAPRSEKDRKEVFQALEQRLPCSSGRALEQMNMPWRNCSPCGWAHTGADFFRTAACWGDPCWSRVKVWGGKNCRKQLLENDRS